MESYAGRWQLDNLLRGIPMKKLFSVRGVDFKTTLIAFSLIILTACATPRVTIGEIEVYGNNEIRIDAPTKQ